ncbi:Uncharacterised protein [uncultured archaeon]|nr:Uncharacterised protein [uncultured archaeon]
MPKSQKPLVIAFCNADLQKSYYHGVSSSTQEGNGYNRIFREVRRECWNQKGPCIKCGDATVRLGEVEQKIVEKMANQREKLTAEEYKIMSELAEMFKLAPDMPLREVAKELAKRYIPSSFSMGASIEKQICWRLNS